MNNILQRSGLVLYTKGVGLLSYIVKTSRLLRLIQCISHYNLNCLALVLSSLEIKEHKIFFIYIVSEGKKYNFPSEFS